MDLLLDIEPTNAEFGDIKWVNGPLTKEYTTQELTETVAQRLFILLRTFTGEWFLSESYGIPYWDILGKKVSKSSVDLILQKKILEENGVKEIVSFNSEFSNVNRSYSVTFSVRVTTGEVTDVISIPLIN